MVTAPVELEKAFRSQGLAKAREPSIARKHATEKAHVKRGSTLVNDNVEKGFDLNTTHANTYLSVVAVDETTGKKRNAIAALPNEILDHVFSQLGGPAPSSSKLYDQPVFEISSSETTNLKSSSLVCQQWRRLIIPFLFRHVRLIPNHGIPKPVIDSEHVPLLDFVHRHGLKNLVTSFTLAIRAVVTPHTSMSDRVYRSDDFTSFWNEIFEEIDPLEIMLVCSPQVLGALTPCEVSSRDQWSFGIPYHILQLRYQGNSSKEPVPLLDELDSGGTSSDEVERAPLRHSVLFNIRPWSHALLNKGSFLKVYKTHDTFSKRPPSILGDLVGDDGRTHTAMIPKTVRDFPYIAIFPVSTHFQMVTRSFPRVDRLYTQFVPRNNILKDPASLDYLEVNDLWMERNTCYAYIMRELFSSPLTENYRYLKYFESGDAADRDAWDMAVEFMKRADGQWKIESVGVFAKEANGQSMPQDEKDNKQGTGHRPPLLSVSDECFYRREFIS